MSRIKQVKMHETKTHIETITKTKQVPVQHRFEINRIEERFQLVIYIGDRLQEILTFDTLEAVHNEINKCTFFLGLK